MREIKFRGLTEKGEWVYGSLIRDYRLVRTSSESVIRLGNSNTQVISKTVGQFTGKLDRLGNEVYEGDILTFDVFEWNRGSFKPKEEWEFPEWAVEWDERESCWHLGGGTNSETSTYKEVIGNIHTK